MVGLYQLKPLGLEAEAAEALDSASLLRGSRAVRVAPAAVDFDSESYTEILRVKLMQLEPLLLLVLLALELAHPLLLLALLLLLLRRSTYFER